MGVADDGFDYSDLDSMIEARRGLGLRCDRDFVRQLVEGSLSSVRAQEYGLLTPEEAAEEEVAETLGADAAAIVAYGAAHPDTWAGFRYDREGMAHVVVASFTADLEVHRRRLAAVVAHPDRLRLRRLPFTQRELERIRAGIRSGGFDHVKQLGIGDGAVNVAFVATAEAVAAQWHRRYGDALHIQVGNLAYPAVTTPGPNREAPTSTITLDEIELSVHLDASEVASGENMAGKLVLHNRGDVPVPIDSGQPLVGMVVRPSTGEVVGGFSGAIAGVGWFAELYPGDEASLSVLVGTASCRPDIGYLLPAGQYEAVVPLRPHRDDTGRFDVVVAPPVAITLR